MPKYKLTLRNKETVEAQSTLELKALLNTLGNQAYTVIEVDEESGYTKVVASEEVTIVEMWPDPTQALGGEGPPRRSGSRRSRESS